MKIKCLLLLLLLVACCSIDGTPTSGCYPNTVWFKQMEQRALDETINPCTDFHTYACGMWRVPYDVRGYGENSAVRDTLSAVKADNRLQLIQYFDRMALRTREQQRAELPPHRLALVDFYSACMDATATDTKPTATRVGDINNAIVAYTQRLRHISNDWPLLNANQATATAANSSTGTSFHWEHVAAQLRRLGVDTFWRVVVQSNWQAAEQQILYMVPPAFDLLRRHASATVADEESTYLYKQYVKRVMLTLGIRVRKAIQLAEEVVNFEEELLALASSTADTVVLTEPQTLASLAHEYPDMRLWQYFNALLHDVRPKGAANAAPSAVDGVLVVANKRYLQKLSQKLRRTSVETLAKWMLVQFFAHFQVLVHRGSSFNDVQLFCVRQLNDLMPNELATLFLELQPHGGGAHWLRNTETDLNRLFDQLKTQFETLLNGTTIFERDEQTKALGLQKLRGMRLLLPSIQLPRSLNAPGGYVVDASYGDNLLSLSQFKTLTQLGQLFTGDAISTSTTYGPLHVNAYYRLKKNAIELPIGLLRPPFYESCLAEAKIYGSLVYMLGHELLHGFDYDGLNYDEAGNVANAWGVKSIIQFGTKSNCYLGARYTNAELQINENIADSEGLRLALDVFKKHNAATARSPDALKLFFLSFAQTWCTVDGETAAASEHAGNRERVNNALGNFNEFAEVYRCSNDSNMHPSEKCRIW